MVLEDSLFDSNSAVGQGGAIYFSKEDNPSKHMLIQIVRTEFVNNSALCPPDVTGLCNGGALYFTDFIDDVDIISSVFQRNKAERNGGN